MPKNKHQILQNTFGFDFKTPQDMMHRVLTENTDSVALGF